METHMSPATESIPMGSGSISLFRSGTGRPVLFLHGLGGSGAWSPFHELVSRRADLIAPDHPGFGNSNTLPELHDVDDLVYHYVDLLDQLGIDEIDLVGTSFGGWLAAELAVHSPHRVRRLVLLGPVGLQIPEAPVADVFLMSPTELVYALFHRHDLVEAALVNKPGTEHVTRCDRDLGALARFAWEPCLNNPKLERRLYRITAPTLVVAAGADRVLPRVHCERYTAAIPGAELLVLNGCGHALHAEYPETVAALITNFLAR
jgi:pimeloyl-ACP methyl ester carboxylesterase